MDAILEILNSLRESQHWPLYRALLAFLWFGLPMIGVGAVVCRDEILAAIREGFRLANISNTAAAIDSQQGESLVSKKLRGDKVMSVDWLATIAEHNPALCSFIGLELVRRFGMPELAVTAAQVAAYTKGRES